jgi:peptide/nickel transport system permease protein
MVDTAETTQLAERALRPRLQRVWLRSLLRSPVGLIGLLTTVLMVFIAVAAPVLAPYPPTEMHLQDRFRPPAWSAGGDSRYLLGTDQLGRDLLSRMMYGARISLLLGVLGVVVSIVVGVALGLVSGYMGGRVDALISRMLDTFMAIPFIILAMAVLAVIGPRGSNLAGIISLIAVLGLTGWVTFTRVVRGEVLTIKFREYVEAARCIGQTNTKILLRHVLPNVTASIIVMATLQVGTVIIAESSLSFLGLGVQHPTVTWGSMLSEGRNHLATSWWLATFPGVAITVTVLGVILLGDWLRDVLDPRLKL